MTAALTERCTLKVHFLIRVRNMIVKKKRHEQLCSSTDDGPPILASAAGNDQLQLVCPHELCSLVSGCLGHRIDFVATFFSATRMNKQYGHGEN